MIVREGRARECIVGAAALWPKRLGLLGRSGDGVQ